MFKIAYGAGHNNETTRGIWAKLNNGERINEWILNDRIARHFAEAAEQYEDVELLRVDDPEGIAAVDLKQRVNDANAWGADFFLSIHHNGGINGGSGGGLCAFSYNGSIPGAVYRDAIYNECIAAGGIVGNRYTPKAEAGFYVIKYTKMPAVLVEYGFMDSTADIPKILAPDFARSQAYATMEAIAKVAGLKKKPAADPEVFYRVQVGAFNDPANAARLKDELLAAGYDAFIVTAKK
jgi:N-acetylmuramoyl-L-alanine amidase